MLILVHAAALSMFALPASVLGSPPQQSVADSAGVRVAVSRTADVRDDSWRLAPAHDVEIGVVEGRPEYQLDRVSGAAFLSSGTIVLANSGTRELRFYDRNGQHMRSVGGRGGGPGEFESILLGGVFAGDSIIAWDAQQRRLTVFDSAGRFARTQAIVEALGPAPLAAGVLRNGSFVALRREIPLLSSSAPVSGIVRPTATLLTVPREGEASTVGSYPDTELSIREGVNFGVVFGRSIEVRGRGDRIAVGNTDSYSIRVYGGGGQLLHVIRQARQLPAVTEGDFERARPSTFPTTPVGARMRAAVEQMPKPATYPAFAELRFDSQGNLWVKEFARQWDERHEWQVFGPDGRLVGRLSLAASHTLLDATQTHALVRVVDELDVQKVRVYRLEK